MEHSDRAKEVTHKVCEWLANDQSTLKPAMVYAAANDTHGLSRFITRTLRVANSGTRAHDLRRDLSESDLDYRVDWDAVAKYIWED